MLYIVSYTYMSNCIVVSADEKKNVILYNNSETVKKKINKYIN